MQVLFSGIASPQVVRELVDWAAHQGGTLTVNVPRKPGEMGGICSFVELGARPPPEPRTLNAKGQSRVTLSLR